MAAPFSEQAYDVEFRAVTKRFGALTAVNGVTLKVRKGEFLSLLGPSGCGKTTSLRLIAGFEQPDEGEILIGGMDAASAPPYKRDVNTVFQHYALFPHMSVLDNVAYGLKQRKIGKSERHASAREALELVRMTGRETHRPAMLSGGQQQRVALARALVMRPRVLLLDEPLGALDLKLRKEMQIELKRIQEQVGITFIYVTHDQGEALSMSDRVAVMSNGVIEQIDEPRVIYDRPLTPFVADFIGDMNFVAGEVVEAADGGFAIDAGAGIVVRGRGRRPRAPGCVWASGPNASWPWPALPRGPRTRPPPRSSPRCTWAIRYRSWPGCPASATSWCASSGPAPTRRSTPFTRATGSLSAGTKPPRCFWVKPRQPPRLASRRNHEHRSRSSQYSRAAGEEAQV